MKLTWQPIDNEGTNDGAPYVLAIFTPRSGAGSKIVLTSGFTHQRASEVAQYPRADSSEFFDRGNASTAFSAVVHYEFATVRECSMFQARLGNALGGRGNLKIEYPDGGADTLPGAVWGAIPVGPKLGITATIQFTFTGEAMTGAISI